jgi:hypothetical protein
VVHDQKSVLPVIVSAIALAGCGGSSSSSSSPARGADFVAQANNLCSNVNSQVAQLPPISGLTALKTTVPKELTTIKHGIASFKNLTPPSDKATVVNQYIGQLQTEAVLFQKLVDAVKTGDFAQVKQIDSQGKALQSKTRAITRQLGLTECVKDAQPGSAHSSASSTG